MKTLAKTQSRKKQLAEQAAQTAQATLGISSILVPTDFSPAAEYALQTALGMAQLCGAQITLIHVVEPAATPDFVKAFPLILDKDEVKEKCNRQLQRAAEQAGVPPAVLERLVVRQGRAFNEIVSAARTLKSDLIVIATHGRTGLKHVLMGSTAERVVQHAPCPVLVVRSRGRNFLT